MEVKAKEFEPRYMGWDFKEPTSTLLSQNGFAPKPERKKIWFGPSIWRIKANLICITLSQTKIFFSNLTTAFGDSNVQIQ